MRTKLFIGGALLVGCCLAILIVFSSNSMVNAQMSTQSQTKANQGLGLPAIVPRTLSYAVGSPRFTASDVQAYLRRAYLSGSKQTWIEAPTVSGKPARILSIDFITSKEASVRMHKESTGLPDNALVCYVVLYGPFDMSRVAVPSRSRPMSTMNYAVEVFDTQTGNLLMSWAHS